MLQLQQFKINFKSIFLLMQILYIYFLVYYFKFIFLVFPGVTVCNIPGDCGKCFYVYVSMFYYRKKSFSKESFFDLYKYLYLWKSHVSLSGWYSKFVSKKIFRGSITDFQTGLFRWRWKSFNMRIYKYFLSWFVIIFVTCEIFGVLKLQ